MLRRFTSSFSVLVLGLALGWMGPSAAVAAPPETAPADLTQALADIEAASNARDLTAVMAYYSNRFVSGDGLTRSTLESTLRTFWENQLILDYGIQLLNWEPTSNGYLVETVTRIQGVQRVAGRRLELEAEVRSQQRFENGQIVSQEILTESSQITSGDRPPELTVLLPERVRPGATYEFDAIVRQPLGDRSLLGMAMEEGVTAVDFFVPRPLSLELLSAGGLFKLGQAPDQSDRRWVSAVIIREDGLVVTTRRLQVQD